MINLHQNYMQSIHQARLQLRPFVDRAMRSDERSNKWSAVNDLSCLN